MDIAVPSDVADIAKRTREFVRDVVIPVELQTRGQSVVFEEAGYSLLGPFALNCTAPDEGNMHLLEVVATPEQKERYLRPLAAGEIRSCSAMTEPAPGAGSDPAMPSTVARRDGDGRRIDGRKWFINCRVDGSDVPGELDQGFRARRRAIAGGETPLWQAES